MPTLPPGFTAIPGNDYWGLNAKGMPNYIGPGSYYGGVGSGLESGSLFSSTMPPASMFPGAKPTQGPSSDGGPMGIPGYQYPPGSTTSPQPTPPAMGTATRNQKTTQPNYVSPLGNYNLSSQQQNQMPPFTNFSPFVGGQGTIGNTEQNQYLSPLGFYGSPAGGTGQFYQ